MTQDSTDRSEIEANSINQLVILGNSSDLSKIEENHINQLVIEDEDWTYLSKLDELVLQLKKTPWSSFDEDVENLIREYLAKNLSTRLPK